MKTNLKIFEVFDGETTWTIAATDEAEAVAYGKTNCWEDGPDVKVTTRLLSLDDAKRIQVKTEKDRVVTLYDDFLDVTDTCLLGCDDPGM